METEPHFIRCIKPNDQQQPKLFIESKVSPQLRALPIMKAVQLRSVGYSYRRPFADFLRQPRFLNISAYGKIAGGLLGSSTAGGAPREGALALLQRAGLKEYKDYRMGLTMVSLTREAQQQLLQQQREQLLLLRPIVRTLEAICLRRDLKKSLETHINSIVRLQAHVRRQLLLLEMRGHSAAAATAAAAAAVAAANEGVSRQQTAV
ncbi:hypothetical protein ETH_00015160 [Eimeria tenella]|uniref:Myosin motor domain-containing protein n=1 Tax=Eimeria tenella TaxID=5802 RepID=U6L1E5_EIMTE|nr:hypothetical protein ETH_00015160 [Eimeria tenella]CDJ43991.1 hypothetical protein ETH_00015160 [Eimeria tenella]|eukprot:XP_013234740.1 hypothetical protein ETH_00015160 [Eimeria tenella]